MADGAQFIPEAGKAEFLAADAQSRARAKAGQQRLLKRRLDDACDDFQRMAVEMHGASVNGQVADDIAERIRIGEAMATFAHKAAKEIAALEPYGAKRDAKNLADELVASQFHWPLTTGASDALIQAAAEHELERLS